MSTELPAPPWASRRKAARTRRVLSQELIVGAALKVQDTEGFDALSMRRVAQELGTGPASLYAHVANKEELLQLLVDRVAGEIPIPEPDPDRWREQLREFMVAMREAELRHRDIARAFLTVVPVGPNALRCSEAMLAILRASGASERVAAWAMERFFHYLHADALETAMHEVRARESGQEAEEYFDQVRDYYASLPADRFPFTAGLAEFMTSESGEERFLFGLDLLIRGLEAHIG